MNLMINGQYVEPRAGQTLLQIVRELGLDDHRLSHRPLAAKIAGEVFTLNYIPVREKDAVAERISIRRAMAASGGRIELLRYTDPTGRETYKRTAQFVIFLALRQLWPNAVGKMNCTVGSGLYISVSGMDDFSSQKVKKT